MSLTVFILAVLGSVIYASFFEWTLHRFVMHRPLLKFRYPYEAHALTHHRIFKADDSYHLKEDSDKWTIPMAWWNGPVLVILSASPFLLVGWRAWLISMGVIGLYYGAYEYLHWCMHLPKGRRVERTWFFFRLNGHHLLHHRYPNRNFNVVFPAADLLLGTLLLRSKFRFAQARGPAVPNVQPFEDIFSASA